MLGYEELANAIVLQAKDDYIEALVQERELLAKLNRTRAEIAKCVEFFNSERYSGLTDVNPSVVIETAKRQAHYIYWRQTKGCSKCSVSKNGCPHRANKGNWRLWYDGDKICCKKLKTI